MKKLTYNEYYNRVFGSWLGRIVGDFVGGPCELKLYSKIKRKYGNITYYPEPVDLNYVNDDEIYEVIALIALEKYGINLNAIDIAREWLNLIYNENYIFTAEKIAYYNLKSNISPPNSGIINNPYYDFIGAQMRADIWGLITPGCPNITKHYAGIDASISHAGIGIEGEIFIAILISQAFFKPDIRKNIQKSLKHISSEKESLYTKTIIKALELFDQYPNNFRTSRNILIKEYWHQIIKEMINNEKNMKKEREKLLNSYAKQQHVLPNIGIIILSLLYGSLDKKDPFGTSICTAAMMGYDADCNCGNIGAILGAQIGYEGILDKWKLPLQNKFSTYVKDYDKWKISDFTKRITNIGIKVMKQKCKDKITIIEQT